MDNLLFLRSLNNECINLIAIDPPFATNETFTRDPKPAITEAELAEEKALAKQHGVQHNEGIGSTRVMDHWNWDDDVHPAWKMQIQDDYPKVHAVIEAVEACANENEAAYIAFMAVRLLECRRVLKDTGSIYVHCNSHANSYLRMLLDSIFGFENQISEVIWNYGTPSGGRAGGAKHIKAHETLWAYGKKYGSHIYNPIHLPYSEKYIRERFTFTDEVGRIYRTRKRANGEVQRQYLDESKGVPLSTVWNDIKQLYAYHLVKRRQEDTGYATQKPLALYERIIEASSNQGDMVLDIFAGCATTAIAAERLGRKWIACDMAYRSWTMLKRRFYLNGFALSDMTDATRQALGEHQTNLPEAASRTIGPNELPKRTDRDPAPFHNLAQSKRAAKTTQSSSWSGRISKDEARKLLIERFGPVCWGCGYEPRRPNGTLDDTLLEVDHIRARKASEGTQGNDELYNLALLHRTCNALKRNKLTLEELRNDNALNGRLYVNGPRDLVDLFEAQKFANEQIARHVAVHGYQTTMT